MKKRQNISYGFAVLLIAAIASTSLTITLAGCDNGTTSPPGPQTATYTGTAGGTTYTLVITENTSKAVYSAQAGDSYELTVGSKKSTGTVTTAGTTLTLTPAGKTTAFTVTVSGSSITAMSGTITYTDNTTATAPTTLIPPTGGDGDDPFQSQYPDADFPALTGGNDFIGTWSGSGSYILEFINDGTWTLKMGSSTVFSGLFLVSGNTVHLYLHETADGPPHYYRNSYGTKSGNTLAMEGGVEYLGGESWTKQSDGGGGGGTDPGPGTSIANTYQGTFNGDIYSTDLSSSRNNADFTITTNAISWDHENSGGGVSGDNTEDIPATGTIQNVSTNGGGNLTVYGVSMGNWTYFYSGTNKIGIGQIDSDGEGIDIYIGKNNADGALMGLNALGANASSEGIAATVPEIHISD
jgi:hypothetical protein